MLYHLFKSKVKPFDSNCKQFSTLSGFFFDKYLSIKLDLSIKFNTSNHFDFIDKGLMLFLLVVVKKE